MARFNQGGQWSLDGDEGSLLWKTKEAKDSGKTELVKRRAIDPNSEEAKAIFDKLAKAILASTPKQPTNEQMFGHLVPTEEQVIAAEKEWENKIGGFYEEGRKPIDPHHAQREWGMCKSFRDQLTEEELAKYNKEEQEFNRKSK